MPTLSDCVFDWMRHEFALHFGVCEREIRPDTPLERFLPRERRREFWRTGQREFGLRFPLLQLPPAMRRTGQWLALASLGRTILLGLLLGAKWLVLPLALLSWIGTAALYHWVSRPWATERPDLETFGDLARLLLARNIKTFRLRFGLKPNRDEIFAAIVAILAEMGADPQQITPATRFDELIEC